MMKNLFLNAWRDLKKKQLNVVVCDNLPINALAGAFDNTVVLSNKFVVMKKKRRISNVSFLFILLHEIAHLLQQSIMFRIMSKKNAAKFICSNRESLEKKADEMALRFICEGMWKNVVSLIDFSKLLECSTPCDYDNLSVQWWMVDGIESELKAMENPEKDGKADDMQNAFRKAVEEVSNDPVLKKMGSNMSDALFGLQSEAIWEGIHETFVNDALNSFEKKISSIKKDSLPKITVAKINNDTVYTMTKNNGSRLLYRSSIVHGTRWNDCWNYTNIGFGKKYLYVEYFEKKKEADSFVYSSHSGRMQFLHSMECSGGNKFFNLKKILRWVEFCIDVFNNIEVKFGCVEKKIQDLKLSEYVDSCGDNLFRIMMRDVYLSKYGDYKIKDFFEGQKEATLFTDQICFKKDAGSIAVGSIIHVIQDSFAQSHTKRCLDPFLLRPVNCDMKFDKSDDDVSEYVNFLQIENEKFKIYEETYKKGKERNFDDYSNFCDFLKYKAMPVILYADYAFQEGVRHAHADIFLTHLDSQKEKKFLERVCQYIKREWFPMTDELREDFYKQTLNSAMARDCSEAILYMIMMNFDKNSILDFVKSLYPSFSLPIDITKSGLQYCKENSIDVYYETIVESLMCYNLKESLSSRAITFNRVIVLLKDKIERNLNDSGIINSCMAHVNEILAEIYSWTYLLTREFMNKTYNTTIIDFCNEDAKILLRLINKIKTIKQISSKQFAYMDLCESLLDCFARCYMNFDFAEKRKKIMDLFSTRNEKSSKYFVVRIITEDACFAGTNAKIYMSVKGREKNSLDEVCVGKERCFDNFHDRFERNSIEIFEFYTDLNIEVISSLTIRYDGVNKWLLDKIIVSDPIDEKCWVFNYKDWINKEKKDVILKNPESLKKNRLLVLDVYTSFVANAGTDANVKISLYEKQDDQTEILFYYQELDNSENNFEKGKVDTFVAKIDSDIADISKVKIKHDGTGAASMWHLKKIVVTDVVTEKAWLFCADCWVRGGNEIILSQEKGHCFVVDVYTGNESGAGTDANVEISITGTEGCIPLKKLDGSGNLFEKGDKDSFTICSEKSIGDVSTIAIKQDGKGAFSSWYLKKVVVTDVVSKVQKVFVANRWINCENGRVDLG